MNIFMVAEKPTVAKSIANFLSNGNYETTYDLNMDAIFEYNGQFEGKKAHFKVASTCGHIMNLNFPHKFSWGCNPIELFTCEVVNKEEKYERNSRKDEFSEYEYIAVAESLQYEAKNADKLILWLDCDGEGEAICFEVIDTLKKAMGFKKKDRNIFIKEKVYSRATFSAIEESEMKKAMNNLGKPDLNKALSVYAKHELDLRIGCAFTRYLTEHVWERYDDYISFGPCQTPTLAFCVNRHDEIIKFKPQPFSQIKVEILMRNGLSLALDFIVDKKSQFEENMAKSFYENMKKCEITTVVDVSETREKLKKPVGLNTVEMLRYASTTLGIRPHDAMRVAQKLYINGYISYPRTETTAYPSTFNFVSVLKMLYNESKFAWKTAEQILNEGISPPRPGVDKGDHQPIIPMENPGKGQIFIEIKNEKYDAYPLWQYIAQHFLATLMRPCTILSKTTKFKIGEEIFEFYSRKVIEPGFTKILPVDLSPDPNFIEGQIFKISAIKLINGLTSPPKHLTITELINSMVKYKIGTDASIPVHIKNICERNYVTFDADEQRLIPTKLGIAIIHGFQQIDPELIQPTIRADMEKKLALIAQGKITPEKMMEQTLQIYKEKYFNFVRNFHQMEALFKEVIEDFKPNEAEKTVEKSAEINYSGEGPNWRQKVNYENMENNDRDVFIYKKGEQKEEMVPRVRTERDV